MKTMIWIRDILIAIIIIAVGIPVGQLSIISIQQKDVFGIVMFGGYFLVFLVLLACVFFDLLYEIKQ